VNQDDRIWRGALFHVDEIPQRELELVHAVYEREFYPFAAHLNLQPTGTFSTSSPTSIGGAEINNSSISSSTSD
jgi:hypothetical protein